MSNFAFDPDPAHNGRDRISSIESYLVANSTSGSLPAVMVRPSGDATGATDSAALQAAIDSLKGIGGVVGLTAGRYYLSTGLALYPGIGLVGVGPLGDTVVNQSAVSRLQAVSPLNAPVVTIKVDPAHTTWQAFGYVANLSIFGTGAAGSLTGQHGISIDDANGQVLDAKIKDVIIANMGGDGINITASTACKLSVVGCYLEHCIGNGFTGGLTSVCWIINNYIYDNADGLALSAGGNYYVSNNHISTNRAWGLDAKPSGSAAGKVDVAFNRFWSNPSGAINVGSGTNWFKAVNNEFQNNGGSSVPAIVCGIQADGCQIVGNKFTDSRGASATNFFISFTIAQGLVADNSFAGQHSGNRAISVTSNPTNDLRCRNNYGFNAVGQITNPLDEPNRHYCGLTGNSTTPVASTDYTIKDVDQYVSISGGSGLSITIKDPSGNTIQSGLSSITAMFLPVGFKFNCGAFTGTPTVSSWAN